MGLLDALLSSYGGGLLGGIGGPLMSGMATPDQGQMPPASFADRFNALPGAPQPVMPSGRSFDQPTFDPSTYAPNQAQPIGVGNYQMPRMGNADLFQPQQAMTPPNAQPAQGQLPQPPQQPQMQQPLPAALGGRPEGFFDRLNTGLQSIGSGGSVIGALTGNRTDPQSIAQQNLNAQFQAIRQTLISNGETPQVASSKAMIAAMNPEAAKTILPELFTNKTELKMVKDQFGGEVPYSWNSREQTLKALNPEGGANVAGGGYFNKGVKEYDPTLPGDQYLQQFAPDVQSAIKNFARGDSTPTGNARKGWAENIKKFAQTWGDKTGQQVNDQTFFEKKKLKTELGASGNSTMGGILDNGESSFVHLAELGKSFSGLGNVSHNYPLGGHVAAAQNYLGNSTFAGSDTLAKVRAASNNLARYGQESTKFYAGTGGGVEERMAAGKLVPPESSSALEQAAYLEKEKSLMTDRLNSKFDHIRQTLGEEAGNQEIAKHMPAYNRNIKEIDASIAKLRGESGGSGKPQTVIQNGHTYTLQSDGSYK